MKIKNSQKLKQLQSRKEKLSVHVATLKETAKVAQQSLAKAKNQLSSVEEEIVNLKNTDIIVSEHAIIRYFENIGVLDIEATKAIILSDATRTMIKGMGNGKYPIGDGLKAVVQDNTVVTIHKG